MWPRRRVRAIVLAVLTLTPSTQVADGQSTTPAPSASPGPSSSPSAMPFPRPTLPAPAGSPVLDPFVPSGPPDARARRSGVVVELWLSAPSVGQGVWIQAHVRVTNTRDDAVWGPGGCSLPTRVDADLSAVYAPGETWEGNAAAFKRRAIEERHLLTDGFRSLGPVRRGPGGVTTTILALTDCGGTGSDVARLGPGQVLDVDYAWYPMDTFDVHDQWVRPLPPGRATVTASYDFIRHGTRPTDNSITDPISASTTLELTGTDPGIPSPPELIDSALRDPAFAAWVAADPSRGDWTGTYVGGWPGPSYPRQPRFDFADQATNGVVEIELLRDLPRHVDTMTGVMVDPWTGESLGSYLECANEACPSELDIAPGDGGSQPAKITEQRVTGQEADGSSVAYTIRDGSGLLADARLPTDRERSRLDLAGELPALVRLEDDGRTLLLGWLGGPCDERVVVRIDPHVARIAIVDRSESCDLSGDGSAMVLRFDRPIDAAAVAITRRRVVTAP